ncbi:MAG: hypothetical protein ABSB35_26450 [Bryobacteraceae bacterium]|jgi:phosphate starvation-inducible membrane PsiE
MVLFVLLALVVGYCIAVVLALVVGVAIAVWTSILLSSIVALGIIAKRKSSIWGALPILIVCAVLLSYPAYQVTYHVKPALFWSLHDRLSGLSLFEEIAVMAIYLACMGLVWAYIKEDDYDGELNRFLRAAWTVIRTGMILVGVGLFFYFGLPWLQSWLDKTPLNEKVASTDTVIAKQNRTLQLFAPSIDRTGHSIVLNGVDTRRPTKPFQFEWGDGTVSRGFFPQRKIYSKHGPHAAYTVRVLSTYPDGSHGYATATVEFP